MTELSVSDMNGAAQAHQAVDGSAPNDAAPIVHGTAAQPPLTSGGRSAVALTFARALWRLAAARMSSGSRVDLLRDGPVTYEGMLTLIGAARHQVDLESYILRSDAVGQEFGAALRDAARRGCRVRLLTDWVDARGIARSFLSHLCAAGIDVGVFNRPSLRRPWHGVLPRDHRKLLVVDGTAGIIGGVGIGREWRPDRRANGDGTTSRGIFGRQWRDTAVRIAGPAAEDMAGPFARMRRQVDRPRPDAPLTASRPDHPSRAPEPGDATPALVGIVEGIPWRFRAARAFHLRTLTAQRSIWLADAYFMPSPVEVEALIGAARDGVEVRLLVPSRNDHSWMLAITRRYYQRLLAGGIRIWQWRGAMMHAKTTVVDGHLTRVGSTDFNPLGLVINYELDAVIEDATLGAAAEAMFLDDLAQSREITKGVDRLR